MKNIISEIKKLLGRINIRLDIAKENISKHEDSSRNYPIRSNGEAKYQKKFKRTLVMYGAISRPLS